MVDLEDLKAKALEATPGEWTLRDRGVICGGPLVQYFKGQGRPQIVMCCGGEHIGHEQKTANERFIAAAYPDAVLRLIDRLEKSEAERDALKAELEELKQKTSSMMGVGSGAGNLFVFGDYDSIKAAQTLLLQAENDRAELEAARKQEPCGYMCEDAGITTIYNAAKCTGDFSKHTPVYKSPVPAQQSAGPIAFTENDLLEIASSYSAYAGADGDMYLNGWVKSYEAKEFISLINNRQGGQVMAEQLLKGGENER